MTVRKTTGRRGIFQLYHLTHDNTGQAMVEFALTLWLFIMITFFIIDFGWVSFQKTVFEYGYIHSSWAITAADLGDADPLEEVPSEASYTGSKVSDAIFEEFSKSAPGIVEANMTISNAKAVLHNEANPYQVPGRNPGDAVQAISRTRYMDLNADFTYVVYPLTPIGKLFFGNDVTLEKELTRTRVVGTQHRSE